MRKNILIIALMLCTALSVTAQTTLRSSYFMDRMPMRHKLNPALINDYGYLSMPLLGSINFGVNSNIGASNFLFPMENSDNLATFMHPDVSSSEFLDGLSDNNFITQNFDLTLLSMGFFGWGGFNTLDLTVKESFYTNTPKSVFELLKNGQQNNKTYDMSGGSMEAIAYAELGIGHARRLNDNLVVGAKLKGLFGIGYAELNFDKMDMTMSDDLWALQMQATGYVSALGGDLSDMDNFTISGLGGVGFAVDLGATYENLVDGLTISAAVTDLGFISWKSASSITMEGGTSFEGFTDLDLEDFEGSTEGVMDDITEDLESLTDAELTPTGSSLNRMVNCTIALAGEYDLYKDKITAGLLYTSTFGGPKAINELMLSANFAPVQWFNAAITGSVSDYGWNWGWVINLCPRGFNFFIGVDRMLGSLTTQYIPVNSTNLNVNMGINFPIGKVREGSN